MKFPIFLERFLEKIKLFFHRPKVRYKPEEEPRPKSKGYCEFCKKKIASLNAFYCKYCKKWHCEDHRIAEDHKCEGNPKRPKAMEY